MNVEAYNDIIFNELLLEDIEEAQAALEIGREVLPQSNAFNMSERKFVQMFRLTKHLVNEVVDMVTPFMVQPSRASALTITTKCRRPCLKYKKNLPTMDIGMVLASLRFFGTGSYQEITGTNSYVAISQASTSRSISEVTNALNRADILNRIIRFEQLEALRTRFYEKYQMPGVCGCIDCTHIAIVAPAENEHVYVNRKNYHSINVQLVCDLDLKILNVNARFPGSTHDSHIWGQSAVSTYMEQIYRRNPGNVFYLLGDSGYPTRPWLLTPLPNPHNIAQQRYTDRLCSIRSLVERCNGVLKNRFRCLLRHRTLHYSPVMAGKIANACCVLHNLCIENKIPEVNEPHDVEEPDYGIYAVENFQEIRRAANPDLLAAREIQRNIIDNHFNY